MGEIKAKTLIERLGFVDPDKKSSEHDKIQIWLYRNAHKVIDELFVNGTETFEIQQNEWELKLIEHTHYYTSSKKQIVGFVDLYVSYLKPTDNPEQRFPCVYFEVKASIPSLGQLLRQLKFYQEYIDGGNRAKIVVVCPDDQYKQILEEQGFYFYKYQDPEKLF